MTHYPRIISCLRDARRSMMLDEINAELYTCGDDHMIEPIDDPNCHPLDAAFVMWIENQIFDEMYAEPVYA